MAAVLEEMMEGLALDDESDVIDPAYEFDACKFFDFCADETDFDAQEADRWFRCARQDPPAPYVMKINLTKISKSIPGNVRTTSSSILEAHEHISTASVVTSSDRSVPSSEEKTEGSLISGNDGRMRWRFREVQLLTEHLIRRDEHSGHGISASAGSGLKHHNLIDDDHIVKAKSTPSYKSSKPRTFMKPTASHLAKQINMIDVHSSSYRRSNKLETSTHGCENEDTKKQKLETGFLRKAAQLKHQTLFPHKMTTKLAAHSETTPNSRSKVTIPHKPKLMTEERAQRRRFRSQSKPEANIYAFKALPLNRKILESPSLPVHKKNMPQYSPEFQKFQFKTSGMQHRSG